MKSSEELAEALRPLKEHGYELIQDIELIKGNVKGKIDNVVVGPSGVYVLTTHNWKGTAKLSRRGKIVCGAFTRENSKKRALDQATIVRRQLAAWGVVRSVKTVLVPMRATMDHGPIDLKDVAVVSLDALPQWIRGRTYRLGSLEIEQIRDGLTPQTSQGFWRTTRRAD